MSTKENILTYKKLQQLTGDGIYHAEFRVLVVDDNIFDAELMLRELKRQSQIRFFSKTVTNKAEYEKALVQFGPDVVYCDFNIAPQFNAVHAIRMLKREHPDVPFVLVTGALSEEVASVCLREGIDDYVLKSNMDRLPLSLVNATNKRKTELEKKEVYEKLVRSEQQIRNFARHLNRTLEEERARIAREIHDELGQQLAGIKMRVSSLKKEQANEAGIQNIDSMLSDIDDTIQGLRKIATELRPGILDTLGLIPSLEWLTREFEKKTGVQCKFQSNVPGIKVDHQLSTCFFRICQEALTNISKHANATEVHVALELEDSVLSLRVADNGKGIASEKLENPFSMGLLGMRERANLADAQLFISSEKNAGTNVELKVNIPV